VEVGILPMKARRGREGEMMSGIKSRVEKGRKRI
jgi:hypothetical protein